MVYDPSGRCRFVLSEAFNEATPDSGYFPAIDNRGFVGLDSYVIGGATPSFEAVAQSGMAVIRKLVVDFDQRNRTEGLDTLRIDFEGAAGDLNGHGVVYFRQFGTTVCQLTYFVHFIATLPYEPTFAAMGASLRAVDPSQPRPVASKPPASSTVPTPTTARPAAPPAVQQPVALSDDELIAAALALIASVPDMRHVADNLVSKQVGWRMVAPTASYWGSYSFTGNLISYNSQLLAMDPHDLAVVMAHEGQHAFDSLTSGPTLKGDLCYNREIRAYWSETLVWQSWYGPTGKPNPRNDLEREENATLADAISNNGKGFESRIFQSAAYQKQCGPRSAARFNPVGKRPMPTHVADQQPHPGLLFGERSQRGRIRSARVRDERSQRDPTTLVSPAVMGPASSND